MRHELPEPNVTRGPSRDKDSWGTNVFIEQSDDRTFLVKRPGATQTGVVELVGQGMWNADGSPFIIGGDTWGTNPDGGVGDPIYTTYETGLTEASIGAAYGQVAAGTNYVLVSGGQGAGGIYISSDGHTFESTGYSAVMLTHIFTDGLNFYGFGPTGILYKTTDNGITWNSIEDFSIQFAAMTADVFSAFVGSTLYLFFCSFGSGASRYQSVDAGVTWTGPTVISDLTSGALTPRGQATFFSVDSYLYIIQQESNNADGFLIRSNDLFATHTSYLVSDFAYSIITRPEMWPLLAEWNGKLHRIGCLTDFHSIFHYSTADGTAVPWDDEGTEVNDVSFLTYRSMVVFKGNMYIYYRTNVGVSDGVHYVLKITTGGTPLSVTTPGLPFDFVQTPDSAATPGFFFKSTKDAFYYNGSTVTKVSDGDYPATTVRGVAALDGTFYVMDANGKINGSEINDCLTWSALNFLQCQMEPDNGVYLTRLLNFIVAFGTYTTEFFYDAGNATGSPLSPYTSSMLNIGCAVATSVVQSNNQIFFIGVSKQKGRSVYALTGTTPEIISTASIERLLNADDLAAISSFSVKISGHNFYVLTLGTLGITLAFDLVMRDWKEWTSLTANASTSVTSLTYSSTTGLVTAVSASHGASDGDPVVIAGAAQSDYNGTWVVSYVDANTFTYIPTNAPAVTPATGTITAVAYTSGPFIGKFYTGFGTQDLIQDASGNIYELSPTLYQDNGLPIDVHVRTSLLDGGSNHKKFFSKLQVIGDMASTKVYVRYTGDDYQSWSAYRPADMSKNRALLNRLGDDRRRAFEVRHVGNTVLRLEALELEVEKGTN